MQPVERKPSTLKSVQIDHCSKLQQKYQQDIDLLDDLRLFMRQRAFIEKAYAQSLSKLVQQSLAKRQFPTKAVGETTDDGGQLSMTLLELWKHVMEETQNMAMVRMTAAETYEMKISEQCKQVRANRSQIAKMVFDELNSLQKDVSLSLQEMSKSQKLYRDEEHLAHEARVKAENINNKIKNRTIGRFSSLAKLQQQSSKIAARVEACEVKSTAARNEYILNLRAANAHLHRYYTNDLPDLMQALDGEYYDVWKHFLALLSTTEQHCGDVATQCFKRVAANIGKISRQHNNDCFLAENPVLTSMMQYPFLPQDNDPVTMVCKDHGSELDLDLEREARKWATKIARENHTIRNVTKALSLLKEEKNNKAMNSSSEFLVKSQFAVSESRLEEERNKLRLAEMGRAKAEARIEALREGGVEVDVWLNSASADVGTEDEDSNENGCVKSVESSDRTLTRPSQVPDTVLVPDEYATVNDLNNLRLRSDSKSMVYPIWCVAVYDYQAANADELSIQENENLQVLGEGTGDGWLRARNNQGVEGLVPENYIRVWNPVADSDTVDVNEENVDDGIVSPYAVEGILSPYAVNSQQLEIIEQADMAPYACNNPLMNVFHPAKLAHNPLYSEVPATVMLSEGEKWARALFDYEATCDEELSFQEGQLIRVISTENDGVDDGWWHGEVSGTIGLFPSLVVEELFPVENHQDSNHISSSSGQPQASENLPANVYGNVPTTKTSSAPSDGTIVFTASSSRCAQESPAKIRLAPSNVQSLLNDGTESAV